MVLQEACLNGRSEKRVLRREGWEIPGLRGDSTNTGVSRMHDLRATRQREIGVLGVPNTAM